MEGFAEPNPDPYNIIVKDPDQGDSKLGIGSGTRSFTVDGFN